MSERLEIALGILREPHPYYLDIAVMARENWQALAYAKNSNKIRFILWDTPNGLFLEERVPEKRNTQNLHRVEPEDIEEILKKLHQGR